jgi:hypothetical protein
MKTLKDYAKIELKVYRRISNSFIKSMGQILGWSTAKQSLLRFGVFATYWFERLWHWRRMLRIEDPVRPGAMG